MFQKYKEEPRGYIAAQGREMITWKNICYMSTFRYMRHNNECHHISDIDWHSAVCILQTNGTPLHFI